MTPLDLSSDQKGSIESICEALFRVEYALHILCSNLGEHEALRREAKAILVSFQQRRIAFERLQNQQAEESKREKHETTTPFETNTPQIVDELDVEPPAPTELHQEAHRPAEGPDHAT